MGRPVRLRTLTAEQVGPDGLTRNPGPFHSTLCLLAQSHRALVEAVAFLGPQGGMRWSTLSLSNTLTPSATTPARPAANRTDLLTATAAPRLHRGSTPIL